MKLKVESTDWYLTPKAMGDYSVRKTVKLLKDTVLSKFTSKNQKLFINTILELDSTEWHYWLQLTNKYIKQIAYIARRLNKISIVDLYWWKIVTSGCLKDKLDWYLEKYSYLSTENNEYKSIWCRNYIALGMSKADAFNRFEEYHQKIISKI